MSSGGAKAPTGPGPFSPTPAAPAPPHQPAHGFNASDVTAFLARDAGRARVYRPEGAGQRASGTAWGAKGECVRVCSGTCG